jgi:hypothetical protein
MDKREMAKIDNPIEELREAGNAVDPLMALWSNDNV